MSVYRKHDGKESKKWKREYNKTEVNVGKGMKEGRKKGIRENKKMRRVTRGVMEMDVRAREKERKGKKKCWGDGKDKKKEKKKEKGKFTTEKENLWKK